MLQNFNFEVKYRPGSKNTKANALSRRPDHREGREEDPAIQIFPAQWLPALLEHKASVQKQLMQAHSTMTPPQPFQWKKNKNELYECNGKIWVPPTLVPKILEELHDSPLARHPGIEKTQEAIERQYLWKDMKDDIIMYVQGCKKCQRSKPNRTK